MQHLGASGCNVGNEKPFDSDNLGKEHTPNGMLSMLKSQSSEILTHDFLIVAMMNVECLMLKRCVRTIYGLLLCTIGTWARVSWAITDQRLSTCYQIRIMNISPSRSHASYGIFLKYRRQSQIAHIIVICKHNWCLQLADCSCQNPSCARGFFILGFYL